MAASSLPTRPATASTDCTYSQSIWSPIIGGCSDRESNDVDGGDDDTNSMVGGDDGDTAD